jgi:hypothetical protein
MSSCSRYRNLFDSTSGKRLELVGRYEGHKSRQPVKNGSAPVQVKLACTQLLGCLHVGRTTKLRDLLRIQSRYLGILLALAFA